MSSRFVKARTASRCQGFRRRERAEAGVRDVREWVGRGEASQVNATSRLTGTRASDPGCEVIITAATPNEAKWNTWMRWCGGGSDGYT
jgi:hypothetical protein